MGTFTNSALQLILASDRTVTGNWLFADHPEINDDIYLYFGTDEDYALFYYSSSDSFVFRDIGAGTDILSYSPSTKMVLNSDFLPNTANSYDLGSTAKEFRALYLGSASSGGIYLGLGQEQRIYQDPSVAGYLRVTGASRLHFHVSASIDFRDSGDNDVVLMYVDMSNRQLVIGRNTPTLDLLELISYNSSVTFTLTDVFAIKDQDDSAVTIFELDSSARTLKIGNTNDSIISTIFGSIIPGSANSHDLGSSSSEFRALYLGQDANSGLYLGSSQNTRIYDNAGTFTIYSTTTRPVGLLALFKETTEVLDFNTSDGGQEQYLNAVTNGFKVKLGTLTITITFTDTVFSELYVTTDGSDPSSSPTRTLISAYSSASPHVHTDNTKRSSDYGQKIRYWLNKSIELGTITSVTETQAQYYEAYRLVSEN